MEVGSWWPAIRTTANRLSVAMATWQPRALGDEAADKLAKLQGAGGERGRLGRRRPEQGCRAAVAASPWLAGDAARLCLARSGEGEHAARKGTRRAGYGRSRAGVSAGCDAAARAHARAIRALWARPVHARKVFDAMPWHATGHR